MARAGEYVRRRPGPFTSSGLLMLASAVSLCTSGTLLSSPGEEVRCCHVTVDAILALNANGVLVALGCFATRKRQQASLLCYLVIRAAILDSDSVVNISKNVAGSQH